MTRSAAALLVLLVASSAGAHPTTRSPHRLGVLAGLGYAFAADVEGDASGSGGFGEVEYIYHAVEWATPRAYAGVLLTGTGDCDFTPCEVSATIAFLGGKGRLLAPIPYVAPFIELGFGASVGSLRTRVGNLVDASGDGVMYHVPVSLGLALGEHRSFELSLQYLVHPEQEQINGALAFGFGFEL